VTCLRSLQTGTEIPSRNNVQFGVCVDLLASVVLRERHVVPFGWLGGPGSGGGTRRIRPISMVVGGMGFVKRKSSQFLMVRFRYSGMTFLLWLVAVLLVVWGVVLLVNGSWVPGVLLIGVGLFLGASGGYSSRRL
jgi:hypothetical protein